MNDTADYRMNPAEDTLLRGDQLAEGMWVLAELTGVRQPRGTSEDDLLRRQRFRRVSNLQAGAFTGTWVDGYQETHLAPPDRLWIVKKAPADAEAAAAARKVADLCRSATELGLSPAWTAGPVFETDGGGAFTLTRNGKTYTVAVTPSAGEGR